MVIENWQLGIDSKLTPVQRMVLHNEWLEQQHREVRNKIDKKYEKPKVEINEGFPKD